jgi:outer membrane receptor protein involved in Fe transport
MIVTMKSPFIAVRRTPLPLAAGRASALLLCAWLLPALPAQNAPAAPALNAAVSREEAVELSPFVVDSTRDTGWVASTTLVGTRTNEQLVNLPMTVDAITADFMADMNAFTLEDAAIFVANVNTVSDLDTKVDDNRSNYRGMELGGRANGQSSRNFFLWYAPTDTYNIERIDFNKGSNSLMFGDAAPGGLAATYTKRARFTNLASVSGVYGPYGGYRGTLDLNRKIADRLAVRLNLLDRSQRSYIDLAESNLRAIHGAVTLKLTPTTTVRLEGEAGKFDRTRASNGVSIRTNTSPGQGFVTNNRWYYTSDGTVLNRTSTNPAAIDRAGVGGNTLSLLEGQSAVVNVMTQNAAGTTVASGRTLTFNGYDRSLNLLGVNDYLDRPYNNFSAWIEQRVGRLELEFAYNQQSQRQLRNDNAFATTISVDGNGRPFVDTDLGDRSFGNVVKIGRLTAAYPLKFGNWMSQYLVGSANWQQDLNENIRLNTVNVAVLDTTPNANLANHRITLRAYLDDPLAPSRAFWDKLTPAKLPVTPTFRAGYLPTSDANLPFFDVRYSRNVSLSSSGTYWGGRFRTLFGVRHDTFTRKRVTRLVNDANGRAINPGTPDFAPDAYGYDSNFDLSNTSYTGGLVYHLGGGINLYGTYSESFRWQGRIIFDGTEAGAELGQTREVGIKGNVFDNRLFFNLAAYRVERQNTIYEWSGSFSAAQMEDLFNPPGLLPSDPRYFKPATGINNETTSVLANEKAEGYEGTFQFQRLKGLQARFTVSYNDIEASRDFSHFRELLNAALARGGENASNITTAQNILNANDGIATIIGARAAPWAFNWSLDYEFSRGSVLTGTRLGLYGNWRDNYVIDILANREFRDGAKHPVGLYAMYARKIFQRRTNFRLGIRNLVDLENRGDFIRSAVSYIDASGAPVYNTRYLDRRTVDFSVTVNF